MKYLMTIVLTSLLVLAGCSEQTGISAPGIPESAKIAAPDSFKPMLPAHKLPHERTVNKSDSYGDFKAGQPEVYGITNPPSVGVRPTAEYEPASEILITYSSSTLPWGIKDNLAQVASLGAEVAEVTVVHSSNGLKNGFMDLVDQAGGDSAALKFVQLDNDSVWIRDYGPVSMFSDDGKLAFADFRYYHQRVYDDAIPLAMAAARNITDYRVPLDFEGGSFMSDTKGNCFSTHGLLWNNGTSEANVKKYMKDYLGCKNMYLLKPLANEGTTHVDMLAKLADDNTMIIGEYKYADDSQNYKITNDNAEYVKSLGYNVVRMPMPTNQDGNFRTYINSLFVNGLNMVPVYSIQKELEAQAMQIWQQVMPDWQHIPFNSDDVITWSGAIHCITQTVGQANQAPIENPGYACNGDWSCYPSGGGTVDPPQGCGDIDYTGCCDGQTLQWCEEGVLKTINCGQKPQCGWEGASGFYNCGTDGKADPSGDNPLLCSGEEVCQPDCSGKKCGNDGCGGLCGMCTPGQSCVDHQCVAPTSECDGISYEGCCDGQKLKWCEQGQLKVGDCGSEPECGWDATQSYYNCGTAGEEDPSGQSPISCDAEPEPVECTPQCGDFDCGSDGCGGVCGTCPETHYCLQGYCEVLPDVCLDGSVWNGEECVWPEEPTDQLVKEAKEPEIAVEISGDGSCSSSGHPAHSGLGLLFLALLGLAVLRFRTLFPRHIHTRPQGR